MNVSRLRADKYERFLYLWDPKVCFNVTTLQLKKQNYTAHLIIDWFQMSHEGESL